MHGAGAIKYLQQHYDLQRMRYVGASAGALVATIAACGVSPHSAVDCAYRCCQGCTSCHPLGRGTSCHLKLTQVLLLYAHSSEIRTVAVGLCADWQQRPRSGTEGWGSWAFGEH